MTDMIPTHSWFMHVSLGSFRQQGQTGGTGASCFKLGVTSFHVVGGSFMKSGGIAKLAPPPEKSRLQQLFRKEKAEDGWHSFFSDDGETPWGEIVLDAVSGDETDPKNSRRKRKSKLRLDLKCHRTRQVRRC
jgi:hypothetical protein